MELRFASQFLVKLINAIESAGWVLNAEKKGSRNQSCTTGNNTSDTGGCCGQSTRPQSRTKMARMHVASCKEHEKNVDLQHHMEEKGMNGLHGDRWILQKRQVLLISRLKTN